MLFLSSQFISYQFKQMQITNTDGFDKQRRAEGFAIAIKGLRSAPIKDKPMPLAAG
jgi:hypothetical protein